MDDYLGDFNELWRKFEEKDDGDDHILPKKVGKEGKITFQYQKFGDAYQTILNIDDFPVEYLTNADDDLNEYFLGKDMFDNVDTVFPAQKLAKLFTFGKGMDYYRRFYTDDTQMVTYEVFSQESEQEFPGNNITIGHAKPVFRGKGRAILFSIEKSKEKMKDYFSKALSIIQEGD